MAPAVRAIRRRRPRRRDAGGAEVGLRGLQDGWARDAGGADVSGTAGREQMAN